MPPFFATLSSADLKWNGIVSIIGKLHKLDVLEENIKNLSYQDRYKVFSVPSGSFFKEIIADGPLGKTKNYAIRVEFQVRVSPCAQCALFSLGGQRTYFNFKQLGRVCSKKKKNQNFMN